MLDRVLWFPGFPHEWFYLKIFQMILILFIFGLFLGSFLNVIAECLMSGKSFIKRRSCCLNCGHPLSVLDLIPIVSFVMLGRKCRYCRKNISWQYPLSELATGILFGLAVFFLPPLSLNVLSIIPWIYTLFIISILEIIFLIDLKYGLILDKVVFPAVVIILAFYLFMAGSQAWMMYQSLTADTGGLGAYLLQTDFLRNRIIFSLIPLGFNLLGSLGLAILFLVVIFLTKGRGMGGGDVRLVFLVGLITGWPSMVVALFLSFLTGAIVSVMLILIGKKHFGQTVPFGPFLVTSTLVTMFWGQQLLEWYLKLF